MDDKATEILNMTILVLLSKKLCAMKCLLDFH